LELSLLAFNAPTTGSRASSAGGFADLGERWISALMIGQNSVVWLGNPLAIERVFD
jgi:hypothetical protein